jgi:alpha-mannosidase
MIAKSFSRFATLVITALVPVFGAEHVVWQIGKPDKSYDDLAIARNYPAFQARFGQKPLVFEIGRSSAAQDWPFVQPGPDDAWGGAKEHPFTIRFTLPEAPRGLFTLRVDLTDAHSGRPPVLQVGVGGQAGRFPLQPGGGDVSLNDPAHGKPQQVEMGLPASLFRQGTNEVTLTAIDGAWLIYDAITLLNDPEVNIAEADVRTLTAEASPFYLRKNGTVRREVLVKVALTAPSTNVVLRIEAGGEATVVPVTDFAGFGAMTQTVSVPDSPEPLDVTVTAQVGAHSRSTRVTVKPAIKWKVFVAGSAHTDIGYTDIQPRCVQRHNENTDLALALMEKYPDFKWNLEVAWQAENYLAANPGAKAELFLRFAREGRLGVQALYCNLLTALCSSEAACRFTWFAHSLKTRYGIPYGSAMISDVPTQEASLPMLLANSGIRYFSSGINNDRAYTFDQLQRQSPCWWEGPDGSRVLMNYASSYAQASGWGLEQSLATARSRVLGQLQDYEKRADYPYDAVFLHGAVGDNSTFGARLAEIAQAWNAQYEYPKIILCQNAEFFEYIEKNYGSKLPVVRGSAGAYWEDGAGSSAVETALCRNAEQTVASAEKCLALVHSVRPDASYPAAALYSAWRNCLLYDEHTWGAHCSISQPDSAFTLDQWKIKAQFAVDADREAKALLAQGATELAALVKTDARSLLVINPASWARSDIVQVTLPKGLVVADPDVPSCETPGGTLLLIKDVPSCGYKVLSLAPGARAATPTDQAGSTLESPFYRVAFNAGSGAVISLFDKELKRELVDPGAPYQLNQYLYVAGGKDSRIVMNPHGPEPALKVRTSGAATLHRVRLGDLGERMIITTSAPMTPTLTTEVTVWNHLRRVDILNRFEKTETYDKEAVYFAFPFAAEQPTFRYECPAGIVNANRDMLPGACLDWFAVQHFVEIESTEAAIAWSSPDAPLVCFQDINRGKWQRNLPLKTGHIYAYVLNNYWHTNYKAGQGGPLSFRFSITSRAKADNTASAQFGWSAANSLLPVVAEPHPSGPLSGKSASLVEIAEPNVLLLAAKQADAGDGLVLRLWETSGRPTTAHLRLNHLPATRAMACNLVEDPEGALHVQEGQIAVPIRGSGLATLKIQ